MAFVLTSLYALVSPTAQAVEPGRNGRIVFTSGREDPDDKNAKLYLREAFGSSGFGDLSATLTPFAGQSRHPSWSPDRTKIVFATGTFTGDPKTEEYDLFILDVATKGLTALDLNEVADGKSSDHPAWSPDGTRIAFEHQTKDNEVNRDIRVKTLGSSQPAMPITTGNNVELKAAWSRDSSTLYYATQLPAQGQTPAHYNIVKQPASGGTEVPVLDNTGRDEYQPAISADGTKMCWTQQSTPGVSGTADIFVGDLTATGVTNPVNLSEDPAKGDINCVWSPDGKKVAYSNGVFNQGRLVMENSDNSSPLQQFLADDEGSNNFDGNADWAPDAPPECPDTAVTTKVNTSVTIPLECTDTGPEYERTDPNGSVANDDGPKNGTITDRNQTGNPSTITYKPNPGFSGTDTVKYRAFDKAGFGTDKGTVTITVQPAPNNGGGGNPPGGGNNPPGEVQPKCAGLTATIVGSGGNDSLVGTARPDVIVAGAGNDTIRSARGNDVVCAGSGNDRVNAGAGRDRVNGGSGRDSIVGGAGNDRLNGGAGRDKISGGKGRDQITGTAGNDRLVGGAGNDRVRGGKGRDRLFGNAGADILRGDGSRDTCTGGGGRNRIRCEIVR